MAGTSGRLALFSVGLPDLAGKLNAWPSPPPAHGCAAIFRDQSPLVSPQWIWTITVGAHLTDEDIEAGMGRQG